ncbi:MAG: hypothetical protein IH901_02645 [Proteobacteria bacterium]|nr:hypothetical protein [Pseudomonadota bacterium]
MWKWIRRIILGAGALLAFASGIGPGEAVSNLSDWASLAGLEKFAQTINTQAADNWGFIIGVVLILGSAIWWFVDWRRGRSLRPSSKYGPPLELIPIPEMDQISLLDFWKEAQKKGFEADVFARKIKQAGYDQTLEIWGCRDRNDFDSLKKKETLISIPNTHWENFEIHVLPLLKSKKNLETLTNNPRALEEKGFINLKMDRKQALGWLALETAQTHEKKPTGSTFIRVRGDLKGAKITGNKAFGVDKFIDADGNIEDAEIEDNLHVGTKPKEY